jgi:CheY-like chemotaxis protein
MIRTVLLVDDDREMLLALREGFGRYAESMRVLLAGDGLEALEVLKREPVSLVVTDLKMPRMDGFELLAAIMGSYPDIPVIIITGYSTPDMERLARQGGAVGFTAKPFLIENLARQILTMLRRETEGGTLHNVSSGMFLQLVEMEQKTCTIRLEDKASGKKGALFFVEGALFDARAGNLQGESAAYEIFGWEQVSLSIQDHSAVRQNRIQKDLHPLILEAARRKDEKKAAPPAPRPHPPAAGPEDAAGRLVRLRDKIEQSLGPRSGVESVFADSVWDERVKRISRHGAKLNLGGLVLGYIDRGDPRDYMVVAGDRPTVIAVNRKCPRDKLMQILTS